VKRLITKRHDISQGSHCAVIYDRLRTLLQVAVSWFVLRPRLCVGVEEKPGVQQQSGP
jgi:hypothetical protein